MAISKIISNKHSRLVYKNKILFVEYITNVYHNKEVCLECLTEFNKFIESLGLDKVSVVIKLTDKTKFSLEGREVLSSVEATKYVSSAAIVVSSGFQEMLGNLYVQIGKPNVPTKLFRSEVFAVDWLKSQRNDILLSNNCFN